ncbi:hypothetical protein OAE93_01665 [bacterium]|nr:hypothetical protein [bacterium]
MENESKPTKEKKHSNWFLAEYYVRKVVAWYFILAPTQFYKTKGTAMAILVLAGVYLLINTKKE